jgi:GntR family transcriptional regulator
MGLPSTIPHLAILDRRLSLFWLSKVSGSEPPKKALTVGKFWFILKEVGHPTFNLPQNIRAFSMMINTDTRLDQVKTHLLGYINQNQLVRGDQLPSESAMAKALGVSRNTLREAYISLENEGIIVRRHGIGTFIAHSPVIKDSLNHFSPFAQIIEAAGYTPHFQTLSMTRVNAPPDVYEVFAVPPSQKLLCIKRIVLADQQPAVYVDDYFSPAVEETNLNWDSFDGNTVQFLASSPNIRLHQIHSRISAAALDSDIAPHLQMTVGEPVLSVRSIIYALDNQPLTYSKLCFNSNIVELDIVRMIRKQ